MNFIAHHPFDDAVVHEPVCENAVSDVFLTANPFFRRTDPVQASEAIVFSPFHIAFLTAIPLHAHLPQRLQNAAGRHTGYTCTDPCPGSPSSARQIRKAQQKFWLQNHLMIKISILMHNHLLEAHLLSR